MRFLRQNVFIPIICLLLPTISFALDVDEKLTLRVLRTSSSKKTVLINRGLEDGIAEGDHAKFFLTSGVVARGVVVKTSPSRSIWAIYRLIEPEAIVLDKVMNLKISTPVKLSKDRSKMLSPDNTDTGADIINIPLAPGADDTGKALTQSEQEELAALQGGSQVLRTETGAGLMNGANWEVWGLLHFNGLQTTSDTEGAETTTGNSSTLDFSGGVEWYFEDRSTWLHDFSLYVMIHNVSQSNQNLEGGETTYRALEYGAGASYHFLADPFSYNRLITYLTFAFGVGTTEEEVGSNNTQNFDSLNGSSTFFSVGAGLKFYLSRGFGFKAMIDYYRRAERYSFDDGTGDVTRIFSGPRIQAGLSYRF